MFSKASSVGLGVAALTLLIACEGPRGEKLLGPISGFDHFGARGIHQMVTLKGSWDNTELPAVGEPPAGCTFFFPTSQVGRATHLGNFRGTGATCGNPQGPPTETPPFWDHEPAPPYLVADFTNEMVWTAANGDELWLRPNEGVFVQSVVTMEATVRGTLRIAGGTGRFQGASGTLAVTGGRESGETGDHLEFSGPIDLIPGSRGQSH